MKKILFLLIIFVGSIASDLKADIVAYQLLYHPIHKTRLHLLFDIHLTKVDKTKAVTALKQEIIDITSRINLDDKPCAQAQISKHEGIRLLNERIERLHAYCGLLQQQKDLQAFVMNNRVSLINEDSAISHDREAAFLTTGCRDSLHDYIVSRIGRSSHDGAYRANISPLQGMGQKLCGAYSTGSFEPLPHTGGYYYNVDSRRQSVGIEEGATEKIDSNTLDAIEALRTTYNQSDIVVSLGAHHCAKTAHLLCTQQGYQAGPFIIHQELKERRPECPEVNTLLTSLKYHGYSVPSTLSQATFTDNLAAIRQAQKTLISYSLDVAAALQQGLATPLPAPRMVLFVAPKSQQGSTQLKTGALSRTVTANPVAMPPFSASMVHKYSRHAVLIKRTMIAGGLLGLLFLMRSGNCPPTSLLANSIVIS